MAAALCLGVLVALAPAPAPGGIANTKHNLTKSGRNPIGDASSTEICAYCHTPHTETDETPLWQQSLPEEQDAFVTYDSFGRSNLSNSRVVGSVSLACLSCHDGTQALNVVSADSGGVHSSSAGMLSPNGAVAVGDLALSHPVGIPYGAARASHTGGGSALQSAVVSSTPAIDPRANRQDFKPVESDVIDDVRVWWLETGASGRQRSDIHLYSRPLDSGEESEPYVECASCHDPHAETYMFLRTTDPGTPVCLACHDK